MFKVTKCANIINEFRAGLRQHRGDLLSQWLMANLSKLYGGDENILAADLDVDRSTVTRWRQGKIHMPLVTIDLCRLRFARRAKELNIDPKTTAVLCFGSYDADLVSLASAGYMRVLSALKRGTSISPCQFKCFFEMAGDPAWRLAFELGQSNEIDRIARRILARATGPGPVPQDVEGLRELYRTWRGPWHAVMSCMSDVS
jgi:hypothetical protein